MAVRFPRYRYGPSLPFLTLEQTIAIAMTLAASSRRDLHASRPADRVMKTQISIIKSHRRPKYFSAPTLLRSSTIHFSNLNAKAQMSFTRLCRLYFLLFCFCVAGHHPPRLCSDLDRGSFGFRDQSCHFGYQLVAVCGLNQVSLSTRNASGFPVSLGRRS